MKYIFAISFPGCMNPPIICMNGWMINCSPVIAYSTPKKRIEMVARRREMKKPHL